MRTVGVFGHSQLIAKACVITLVAGLLGAGIAVTSTPLPARAAVCSTSATGYAEGDGTSGNPFKIATAAELIRLSLNSSDWSKYFLQTADINLGSCSWTPIGNSATKFTGSYDGSGFTIQGFKISNTTDSFGFDGLFGSISSATIQNLILVGQINSISSAYVGGLAADATTSSVSKVLVQVDFTYSGDGYLGGLVGNFTSGSVRYSSFLGSINASNPNGYVGSFTGFSGGGETLDSYSRSTMSGASTQKGGMSGSNGVKVSKSYSVTSGANFGVTALENTNAVSNSFWDTTLSPTTAGPSGNPIAGATGKTTQELKDVSLYTAAGWNIVSGWEPFSTSGTPKIWGICSQENNGYPFLLWEYTTNPCTSAPGAPVISAITAGNGQLSVAFTAPGSDGGAAITNYDYSIDDGVTWVTPSTPSTSSPIVIIGLENATSYQVKIRARNSVGGGTGSNSVSGTPVAPPPPTPPSSGSSADSENSLEGVPEAVVTPKTVRQITVEKASGDKPARLLGRSLTKGVIFGADSARLSSEAKQRLRQAVKLAKASGGKVAVTGFAARTSRGSAYERSIAQKRALAVARYIRAQGFDGWIYYHGLSGRQSLAFEGNPRRVEIRILK